LERHTGCRRTALHEVNAIDELAIYVNYLKPVLLLFRFAAYRTERGAEFAPVFSRKKGVK
jgi:hypothetical protein